MSKPWFRVRVEFAVQADDLEEAWETVFNLANEAVEDTHDPPLEVVAVHQATREEVACRECGEPCHEGAGGVYHHSMPEAFGGIDHDRDADHVAVPEEEEE